MPSRIATTLPYIELEVATGNYDTTRTVINRVILHTMVGTWQAAAARFDNPTQKVSVHYGVKLDGGLIHWLEEYYTAYHAGNYVMNQQSIGIEHEDGGDYNGVRPDVLYETSAKLVANICTFYSIPIDRQHILKHSEVIATGCPDALDVDRIVSMAQAIEKPTQPVPTSHDLLLAQWRALGNTGDMPVGWHGQQTPVETPPSTPVPPVPAPPVPPVPTPPVPAPTPPLPPVVPQSFFQKLWNFIRSLFSK